MAALALATTARQPSASRHAGLALTATCQAMRILAYGVVEATPETMLVAIYGASRRLQTISTITVGHLAIG